MRRVYHHRINTIEGLRGLAPGAGIEFDLRSSGDEVLITHDPFTTGPRADEYFEHIGSRPCIFNIKTEGIEEVVRALASKHGIEDYFMLDCSVPAMMKLNRQGERRLAVRYSEVEPIEAVLAWAGKAEWVWIDCFTAYPGTPADWVELGKHFRLCLVSPELQAHTADTTALLRETANLRDFHAVCTKVASSW